MNANAHLKGICLILLLSSGQAWPQANSVRWPVDANISRVNYGYDNDKTSAVKDFNCGANAYDGHAGTDIGAGRLTPVYAAATGWVQRRMDGFGDGFLGSTDGNGFGNHVVLYHTAKNNTIYGHFTSGNVIPNLGDTVACGTLIGKSGTSGNSSGPHMHFEIRLNVSVGNYYSGTSVDPFSGSCSTPVLYWTQLNANQVPVTTCQTTSLVSGVSPSGISYQIHSHLLSPSGNILIEFLVPEVESDKHSLVHLEIFDLGGKLKSNPVHGFFKPGAYSQLLKGKDYPSGLYFGQISIGQNFRETFRILKPL